MATTALWQLRQLALNTADMVSSSFRQQFDVNQAINASLAEYNDLIVRADAQQYLTGSVYTVTASASSIPLSSIPGFYRLKGLDFASSAPTTPDGWVNVYPLGNFANRNLPGLHAVPYGAYVSCAVQYMLVDNTIQLRPAASAPGTYQVWYYPTPPVLTNDGDTFYDDAYMFEYVAVDVAIKLRDMQESDVSVLMARRGDLKERIQLMAGERDQGMTSWWGNSQRNNGGFGGGWGPEGMLPW